MRDALRPPRPALRPARRHCCRSARTRAGGASSSRRTEAGPTTPCWTSQPGPAAVALELARQKDCYVVGVDQSPEMLDEGRRRVAPRRGGEKIRLVEGDARRCRTRTGNSTRSRSRTCSATSTTRRRRCTSARVVKPGGTMAGLEFGVPSGLFRPPWRFWTRVGLPRCRPGRWRGLARGRHVPRSVDRGALPRLAIARLLDAWRAAGITDARRRRMCLGGGVVTWGHRR